MTGRQTGGLPGPGTGYLVTPDAGPGPGVLLLPSPWGLTTEVKEQADRLADAGFSVLAPDLNDGFVANDEAQAIEHLGSADMNVVASLVQSSARLLRHYTDDPEAAIGVVGYAAGASWGLWLSVRLPELCAAVVAYYGTQTIDFAEAQADYLLHCGTSDTVVTDEDAALLGLSMQLAKRPFRVEFHEAAGHGFAEAHHPEYRHAAAEASWQQSVDFLTTHLIPHRSTGS